MSSFHCPESNLVRISFNSGWLFRNVLNFNCPNELICTPNSLKVSHSSAPFNNNIAYFLSEIYERMVRSLEGLRSSILTSLLRFWGLVLWRIPSLSSETLPCPRRACYISFRLNLKDYSLRIPWTLWNKTWLRL